MPTPTFIETLGTRKFGDRFQRILRLQCPVHGLVGMSIVAGTMKELNEKTPDGTKTPYICPQCNPELMK